MADVELSASEKAYVDELIADFKVRENDDPTPDIENFGSVLRCARVASSCSLRELAEALGVSPMYLSDVERGRRPPLSPERIALAAKRMGSSSRLMLLAAAKVSAASRELVLRDELTSLRSEVARLRAVVEAAREVVDAADACDSEARRPRESQSSAPVVRQINSMASLRAALDAKEGA